MGFAFFKMFSIRGLLNSSKGFSLLLYKISVQKSSPAEFHKKISLKLKRQSRVGAELCMNIYTWKSTHTLVCALLLYYGDCISHSLSAVVLMCLLLAFSSSCCFDISFMKSV